MSWIVDHADIGARHARDFEHAVARLRPAASRSRFPCRRVRCRAASCGSFRGSRARPRCRPAHRARAPRHCGAPAPATSAAPLVAQQRNAGLDQVADDLLDVAADIADLGELGRLDLDEGRLRQLGQAPRNLGLADAGRPDHQDVLGRSPRGAGRRAAAGGASGCAAPRRRRAWRRAGRRCSGRARRRSRAGKDWCRSLIIAFRAAFDRSASPVWSRRRAAFEPTRSGHRLVELDGFDASRSRWCRCRFRRRSSSPCGRSSSASSSVFSASASAAE